MISPLILWSYPGAGKSYFARWLSKHKGFDQIDTDELNNRPRAPLEEMWWRAVNGYAPVATFIDAAARHSRPIVTEYGVWGLPETVARLGELQRHGATLWWFDADRDACFEAWKAENIRLRRPFPDRLWADVVSSIDRHWTELATIFGSHVVRTLDRGPRRVDPEEIYSIIFKAG